VRFAFKVAASRPLIGQEQWENLLLAAGADLRTARRIVFFAPNAAARVWLRDNQVSFPDYYVVYVPSEGAKSMAELPLAPESVFQACLLAAGQCSKVQLESMFSRSATANAVRALGSNKRLQVGPMMIDERWLSPSDDIAVSAAAGTKLGLRQRLQLLVSWEISPVSGTSTPSRLMRTIRF
jgi:hypothetical protein